MSKKKCEDCEFDDTWKLNNDKSPCHWCDDYNEFIMKESLKEENK